MKTELLNLHTVVKDNVNSLLRIFTAHKKNNCQDATVGILIGIKTMKAIESFVSFNYN